MAYRPIPLLSPEDVERFWSLADRGPGCWGWRGRLTRDGYGIFQLGGSHYIASRVAFQIGNGTVPVELQTDHLCRNRACVNPAHLELVTNRENQMRGEAFVRVNAAKTHCPAGHEYTAENTIRVPMPGQVARRCRACFNARERIRKGALRAALRAERAA